MGEKAATPKVLPALSQKLEDKESDVRSAAAEALGQMKEKAASPEILLP